MKTITCYSLYSISGDERGDESLTARFATKEGAEDAKKAPGYPEYLKKIRTETIQIFDSAIEWNPQLDHSSRDSGLAKLTPEERAALGL